MRLRFVRPLLLGFAALIAAACAAESKPCAFCEIAAGRLEPEGVVYRDDKCVAFLSTGPRNPGHVLVVPLVHADDFLAVPADTMHAMTDAARRIVLAIKRTDLKCDGFVLQMNTGRAAGQTVFHAHLHIIPRFAGESPAGPREQHVPLADLAPIAAKIRVALAGVRFPQTVSSNQSRPDRAGACATEDTGH